MTPAAALSTIPKSIRVGPHTYRIKIVSEVSDDRDAEASCNPFTLVIEILETVASSSQAASLLLHELLHAIWADRNLGKRSDEERVVLQYESGLVALFRDNPKLLAWIGRCLK